MTRLKTLIDQATISCNLRGHVLASWIIHPNGAAYTTCIACGGSVSVRTNPLPNEIDIGGELVAIDCRENQTPHERID